MEGMIQVRLMKKMAFVYCVISSLFLGINPLILKEFVIPPRLMVGSMVTLSCVLDLGGDVLQSIKWYKDGTELCSCGPFGKGQSLSHRLMKLEELKCDNMSIRFGPISVTSSGTYKCEASSIAQLSKRTKPSVQTVMGSRNLSVFAYPMDAPIISGLKTHYHAGEYIEAQCTAPPSYPAPDISWAINGKGVDTHKTALKVNEDRGLLRATLSLKLMADAGLFINPGGYALFVCTSVLMDTPSMSSNSKVYWSTESESTEASSDSDSSGDIFRNSNEDDYLLKEEPPDESEMEIEKSRSVKDNSGEGETSQKIVIKKGAQRSLDLPSAGSKNGIRLVPICLSAISLLQGHIIHYIRAV